MVRAGANAVEPDSSHALHKWAWQQNKKKTLEFPKKKQKQEKHS